MGVEKELSVFLPNKPGQLARACRALASAKVNIRAISVHDCVDNGIVWMVVDKPKRAVGALAAEGISSVESEVVTAVLKNMPGALQKLADRLARAKVNVDCLRVHRRARQEGTSCASGVESAQGSGTA